MPPDPVTPRQLGFDAAVASRLAWFASRAEQAILVGRADGRLEWANDAACRLCGFRCEDLVGRRLELFPDDREAQSAAVEHIRARFARGDVARLEASIRNGEGRMLWIELQVTPIPSGAEEAPGWVAVASDISERKRADAALAESEERYRRLVEDSPEPAAVHADGRLVYVNRAALALLGAGSAEAVLGRSVFDFLHPDYHGLAAERILKMEVVGDPLPPVVEKLLRVDGSPVDVELAATPIVWRGKPAIQLAGHALGRASEDGDAETAREQTRVVDFSSFVLELAPEIEDRIAPRAVVSLDLSEAPVALAGSSARLAELICAVVAQASAALPGGRGGLRLRSAARELGREELAGFVPESGVGAGRYLVFEADAEEGRIEAAPRARLFHAAFPKRFPGRGPGLAQALAIARAQGGALRVQSGARGGLRISVALPAARPPRRSARPAAGAGRRRR